MMSNDNAGGERLEVTFSDYRQIKDFSCNKMELEVLLLLMDKKSFSFIQERLNINEPALFEILKKFQGLGLMDVTKSDKVPSTTNNNEEILWRGSVYSSEDEEEEDIDDSRSDLFFEFLSEKLSEAIGPIADVMLEDTLSDFNETRVSFPFDKIPDLVDSLAEDIPRDDKKKEFKDLMALKFEDLKG